MKPKTHKQKAWALYDKEGLTRSGWYETRRAARLERMGEERVVRVEVTVKPVEGRS